MCVRIIISDIYNLHPVSSYTPSQAVRDFTDIVKKDYSYGDNIIKKPWVELNELSVIARENRDQRTFNAFVDETIESPAEAWKWRGTRSKARNKAIAMHAQLTAGYVIPMFMPQNEDSEEDRGMADFMRDGIEWMVENSEYKPAFLKATMGMLINPVTFLGAEYKEVFQTIKKKTDQGFTKEEILDEVLSGFKAPVYSADQVLISNAYDQNIQRHRFIIKKRYIEWTEAKARWEDHEDWAHVRTGIKAIYSSDDGLFYDVKDEDHPHLVEEVTYLNRREDTEVVFLNGIYMGDTDVENNPIKHRNNRDAPKYNVVPFGYQRINEHFFYYKSLMNAQYWDNMLLDAQYEMGMNRAFLDTAMPIAVSGVDKIDSDVIFPNAVVSFQDKDARVERLLPPADINSFFAASALVEKSMDESSVSDTSAGQLPQASQKATSVVIAQKNAQILLQGTGKNLAESMVQYGELMSDIFIQNYSVPMIDEIAGDNSALKYRSFVLKNKVVGGREVSKVLNFDESKLGQELTPDQVEQENLRLLGEVGFPNPKRHIYNVNPELFARMRFLVNIEPEKLFPKNEEFQQAMAVQLYQLLRADPLITHEELVRRVTQAFYRGESDALMARNPQQPQLGNPAVNSQQAEVGRNATSRALSIGLPTETALA